MAASAVLTNPSVERVRAALERAGMAADIVELPGAARTAKAAADFLGCQVAQIANSLVFRAQASDTAVLVMSSGACRVDVARLAQLLGEPIAKADADFVRRHTGFAIGGVAPVGHGLSSVFVEKALAAHDELWAAAGHPHTVFRLSYRELLSITGGREAELAA
ncbi:MAG TPA: YbaK/EbsC family protein [Burkholderiales bacterium]|jgi:prolyl-tRNA editing enzyme YbaK/EbsC (Cys-tRNA(Pro) deacylase)|nr:YbaK/EbsC family protein [Burkholderiales bacterium]